MMYLRNFLVLAFCLLFSSPLLAQEKEVTGTVTDENGIPLPGVNVLIQGTNRGTQTDFDGRFILEAVPGEVLLFSYIGTQTISKTIGNEDIYNVMMQPNADSLEEVVVVGYGTQKERNITGAVTSTSAEDFNRGPQMSPQQLIQGKMAGVNIAQNSGKPGGSNTVRIRGGTSLTGSNDPLYVIDGVPISSTAGSNQANLGNVSGSNFMDQEPVNPLMTLNPNDIESITVLKDASATAIYGSRGANGVIVITTKGGVAGKMMVSLDLMSGVSTVSDRLDVLSADQYREVVGDLELDLDDMGGDTDWQDQIYRTALTQDYNLSFSGGIENTTYRASLGYGSQEGVIIGSELDRANARINLNHSALDDRLTFDLRLNYGQNFSSSSPISNTASGENATSINYEAYAFNPTYPVYDENGNYNHVLPFRINPVSFPDEILDETTDTRLIGNLSTTYKILEPLSLNVNLGYTDQRINRNSYVSRTNPLGEGIGGYANVQKLQYESNLLETVLNFNKQFENHFIDAIAGYSYQDFVDQGLRNTATGFLSDEFQWYSLQAASNPVNVSSFQQKNTLISMYGRVNYDYKGRYLITATVRRDGSSRFGEGNKWGIFPSASVAWRISDEEFFKYDFFSDLKLRISYGVTGNQEIGNYNSLTTLGASTDGYIVGGERITVVLPQQYANPDLQWEQTAQLNAGIDFALFRGRVYGSFDYYDKETTDLLLQLPVPSPTAVNTHLANVGSVQNKGIEVEVGGYILDNDNFQWNSDFNFSRNRNKVLSLSNDQFRGDEIIVAPPQGNIAGGYSQLISVGLPVGTFHGRKFIGIVDGVEQFEPEETIIGSAQPDFTIGFSNSLTYRNWDLSFNFRGVFGNDVYNNTANAFGYLNNLPGRNVLVEAVESGVNIDQPKMYSSRWIEDGSFLRLDNINLGYSFNTADTFLSNARIYLTGQNLLLITGYSGLDPEVNSDVSGTGIAPLGVDYLSYPRAKTVSLGANFSF